MYEGILDTSIGGSLSPGFDSWMSPSRPPTPPPSLPRVPLLPLEPHLLSFIAPILDRGGAPSIWICLSKILERYRDAVVTANVLQRLQNRQISTVLKLWSQFVIVVYLQVDDEPVVYRCHFTDTGFDSFTQRIVDDIVAGKSLFGNTIASTFFYSDFTSWSRLFVKLKHDFRNCWVVL